MQHNNAGLRRYLYEYVIANAINSTSRSLEAPILVSQGRRLRALMEERLNAQQLSFNTPNLTVTQLLETYETVMSENVPGYTPVFNPPDSTNPIYRENLQAFLNLVDYENRNKEQGGRLPISPYDPRWGNRRSVKLNGDKILYISSDDLDTFANGRPDQAENIRAMRFQLQKENIRGSLQNAGQGWSFDDASGLSELMDRMSTKDYNNVRQWVFDGAYDPKTKRYDFNKFMSPEAIMRSRAILDMLAEEGIPYTVEPDLSQGQIRAHITDTNVTIRLTDTRENENWIGRVYDNGMYAYFSTTMQGSNHRYVEYTPTTDEVCDLVRLSLGRPVKRRDNSGRIVGDIGEHQTRNGSVAQDSYYSSNILTSVYRELEDRPGEYVLIRRNTSERTASARFFPDGEIGRTQAETYIDDAVRTARENVANQLDIDNLVRQFHDNEAGAKDGTYVPQFAGDQDIAAVQRVYWDVLRGAEENLLKPEVSKESYETYEEATATDVEAASNNDDEDLIYAGSPEQKIRAHMNDLLDVQIGVSRQEGFDPVRVARYMDSSFSQWRNNDDLVSAMRAAGVTKDKVLGKSFYSDTFKDRLIQFNKENSTAYNDVKDPFSRWAMTTAFWSLRACAVKPTSLRIDDNGIIEWHGEITRTRGGRSEEISGTIGQIFTRGENGEIITKFNSGNDRMIVPGFEARIIAQKPGENKSMEERTRLIGYSQKLRDAIRYQIQSDVLSGRSRVGEPASLNNVYRHLSDTRHPADYYERALEEGMAPSVLNAILASESRRVRYPNELREGSTVDAEHRAAIDTQINGEHDLVNDATMDAWVVTGGRNISLLTEESDGYFDPIMTSGGVNQGVTRYLVEGAKVNSDGSITPSNSQDRTPLMKLPETQFMGYDPFDRQQMTTSNLMNAASVTKPVGTALITAGGWTMEDGIVVSKDFAEKHKIRGIEGEMRELRIGDKISDFHGNKGTISLIVDRNANLSPSEAEAAYGSIQMQELFERNENLDVVMAPFSPVSRFNGGSAREAMQHAEDLHLPDTTTVEGGIGSVSFIVTHMAVDAKTKAYDETEIRNGKGRKASSQLAWALQARNCEKVLNQMYGNNTQTFAELREMLLVCGLDVSPDGTLMVGHDDMAVGGERKLIPLGEVPLNDRGAFDVRQMRQDFAREIRDTGGELEIPFPLTMSTGAETPKATDTTWRVPLLSSHLRAGQDLDDGTSTVHDYTNRYITIREWSLRYKQAEEKIAAGGLSEKALADARAKMNEAQHRAQSAYNAITKDIMNRRFTGKHNFFKEGLMSARLPRSATAVMTGDPRCAIDEIHIGPELAKKMHLHDGNHVLIWRDPVLHERAPIFVKANVDERLTGISVNPAIVTYFEGDFDGDSLGMVNIGQSGPAYQEAMRNLTLESQLVNSSRPKDEIGRYPLAMHTELDIQVIKHFKPEFGEKLEELSQRANDAYYDYTEENGSYDEYLNANREILHEMSGLYRDSLKEEYGSAALSFESTKKHMESVRKACLDTGAKGSESKLRMYAHYIGCDPQEFVDYHHTMATRQDQQNSMYATALKSFGTGLAGSVSQRVARFMRNTDDFGRALSISALVTQGVLQSKHKVDDAQALRNYYPLIKETARDMWRGHAMYLDKNKIWRTSYDEKGNKTQATTEQWVDQFVQFYGPDGMNVGVNIDDVRRVAKCMSDPNTGLMLNIEDQDVIKEHVEPLDRMAYGGDFGTLMELCENGANIYAGRWDETFAPNKVRNTMHNSLDKVLDTPVIAMSDTIQTDNQETLGKRKSTSWAKPISSQPRHNITQRASTPAPVVNENERKPFTFEFEYDTPTVSDEHEDDAYCL